MRLYDVDMTRKFQVALPKLGTGTTETGTTVAFKCDKASFGTFGRSTPRQTMWISSPKARLKEQRVIHRYGEKRSKRYGLCVFVSKAGARGWWCLAGGDEIHAMTVGSLCLQRQEECHLALA
jgi:hypothetical protein